MERSNCDGSEAQGFEMNKSGTESKWQYDGAELFDAQKKGGLSVAVPSWWRAPVHMRHEGIWPYIYSLAIPMIDDWKPVCKVC